MGARRTTLLLAGALSVAACSRSVVPPGPDTPGDTLGGRWRVVHVAIDGGATRTQTYQTDDPQLMGRHLTIAADAIGFDVPDAVECHPPTIRKLDRRPDQLIGETMAARNDPPVAPSPRDYAIDAAVLAHAKAYAIDCPAGQAGAGPPPLGGSRPLPGNANWVVALTPDRIALRWYDDSLLTLDRDPSAGTTGAFTHP